MSMGAPGGRLDLFVSGIGLPVRDVVLERLVEQKRTLRYQPKQRTQGRDGDLPHVFAVDGDTAGRHVVQPRQEVHESGLP